MEKFAYFSKAVLASLPYIDFAPDIIHCNDWQTGLIPVFLHTVFEMIIFMRESKPCLRFITCSFRDAGEFRRLWILQDSRHTFSMHMNWNLMAKQTT